MKRATIIEIIIFLYVILFLYTGISKLMEYSEFRENIADSPVLKPIAALIAWGLPWIEFAVILLLIVPKWRLKGMYASLTLMIVFTGYVIGILFFDKNLPCSCGGILQQLSWPQHVIFNTFFILLAICAIVLQKKEKKAQQSTWNINKYPILGQREHTI